MNGSQIDAGAALRWAALIGALVWAVWTYNRLVRLRDEIGNAFAQIDVQFRCRYDLIPSLVETARRYVQRERDTLEAVSNARNSACAAVDRAREQPTDGGRIAALGAADSMLASMMSRMMAVVEAYPELKADATLRELSEELSHTENQVAFARQAFNDAVLDFNNAAQQFPAVLVARMSGFRAAATLEVIADERERDEPRVHP